MTVPSSLGKVGASKTNQDGFERKRPSPELARLALAAPPCRVVAISGRPPTGDTGLAGKDLLASVAVLVRFFERHRARTDNGDPFCQDEKTRLPAEMLRLDS